MRAPDDTGSLVESYTVHGPSTTNVHAFLEDIDTAAGCMTAIGAECVSTWRSVLAIEWNLPARGDVLSPVTATNCALKVAGLTAGPNSLLNKGARATALGVLLKLTAAEYRTAESMAWIYTEQARTAYEVVRVIAIAGYAVSRSHGQRFPGGPDTADLIPDAIDSVTRIVEGILPGDYTTVMSTAGAAAAKIGGDGPVRTTLVAGPTSPHAPTAATSLTSAARGTADLYKGADKAAHIQVQRAVDPATGKGYWTVMIPGTQSWGLKEENPFDGSGNVMAAGQRKTPAESAVGDALRQAMKQEGVSGKGEPVAIVGHSQGGLVAMNFARHAAASKEFKVTSVTTFGSPVGHLRAPKGVHVMNVENKSDPVPRLDSDRTADGEPRRTRIELSAPWTKYDAAGKRAVVGPHDMGSYATAYGDMASRAADDSLIKDFERRTAKHFQGDSRTYLFHAQRESEVEKPDFTCERNPMAKFRVTAPAR